MVQVNSAAYSRTSSACSVNFAQSCGGDGSEHFFYSSREIGTRFYRILARVPVVPADIETLEMGSSPVRHDWICAPAALVHRSYCRELSTLSVENCAAENGST